MLLNDPQHDIVQSNEIIAVLKNPEAMAFVDEHLHQPADELALKYRGKVKFDLIKLTQILQLYRKARHKIPRWIEHRCAVHQKSYEQCTHADVAQFKANLFSGASMLDLTSGLGVDDYYFAANFNSVTALEADKAIAQMAAYNHTIMGRDNIEVIDTDCAKFDLSNKEYDLIYVDPDRRPSSNNQVRAIDEYHPNIYKHYIEWLKHGRLLVIKLSPMVDVYDIESNLQHLQKIYVISHRNEVKEVLAILSQEASYEGRNAVDIGHKHTLTFSSSDEFSGLPPIKSNEDFKIILEPGKAVIKAQLANQLATKYGLGSIVQNGLYFASNQPVDGFLGRQFEVIEQLNPSWKSVKKYLKTQKISAINIAQRNYFEDVRSIRKKIGIAEGGNDFLLFTQTNDGKAICLRAKLLLT